jgi:hypothetical protein
MSASITSHRTAVGLACALGAAILVAGASACGPANSSTFLNAFDTLTIYAINGTSAQQPSALDMASASAIVPSGACQFDFAFDINAADSAVAYPVKFICTDLGAATRKTGLQRSALAFDAVQYAPTQGYQFDSAMVMIPGQTILIASLAPGCVTFADPAVYGKLVLDSVNVQNRTIHLRADIDPNCGYRSFLPGLPKR